MLAFAAAAEAAQAARERAASARLRAAGRRASLAEQVGAGQPRGAAVPGRDPRGGARDRRDSGHQGRAARRAAGRARVGDVRADVDRRRAEATEDRAHQGRARRDRAVPRGGAVRGRDLHAGDCAESLRFIGATPDHRHRATVALLDAYADLIAYAADANRVYAESLGLGPSNDSYLGQLIERVRRAHRCGRPGVPGTPRADREAGAAAVGGAARVRGDAPSWSTT